MKKKTVSEIYREWRNVKHHLVKESSFATYSINIETNCDCKTVSSILGHANINTTLSLYVHPDMGLKRKCIDRMLRSLK